MAISTNPDVRMQIVREGALEPLILAAGADSIEVQREVAATLSNLAEVVENQGRMVEGGTLQHPKFVLRSKSVDVMSGRGGNISLSVGRLCCREYLLSTCVLDATVEPETASAARARHARD